MQTKWSDKMTIDTIREAVVEDLVRRDWLYVSLVNTEWKHFEDEQDYLRADGAVDTLLDLARKLGFVEEMSGAEAEGGQHLREHMLDRRENGPARLQEIRARLTEIEREVPMHEYGRDSAQRVRAECVRAERERRGYYELLSEKLAIEGDLEIADLTVRYLDGEDIEPG